MISPFHSLALGTEFYAESHAGAAELKLEYAFDRGLEVALVVGDAGLGKTTLLRRLARRIAAANHAVVDVFFPRLDVSSLIAFVDQELGGSGENVQPEDRLRRIAQFSRAIAQGNRGLAILIDDAHLLQGGPIFDALHLLLNLREREGAQIMIVLAGQRALLADLARVPDFSQRISVTATLAPLDAVQTAGYIRCRMRAAGRAEDAFDDEALASIHRRSGGVPRTINRLCEMALLIGQADNRTRITVNDIDSLAPELPVLLRDAA